MIWNSDLTHMRVAILMIVKEGDTMKEIIAYFNNGHEPANYTMSIFQLLITDESVQDIIDAETGEIIFSR